MALLGGGLGPVTSMKHTQPSHQALYKAVRQTPGTWGPRQEGSSEGGHCAGRIEEGLGQSTEGLSAQQRGAGRG